MSGVPLNPDEHERDAASDLAFAEAQIDPEVYTDEMIEIAIYYIREAQTQREAREKAERERDLIAKTYADVAHCTRCPARNKEMYGFNQCGKPCAESILEWVKAQEVPNVQS